MKTGKAARAEKQASAPEEPATKLDDETRFEAYCKYQWRCESHEPGSAATDWQWAEQVVLARHAAPAAKSESTVVK